MATRPLNLGLFILHRCFCIAAAAGLVVWLFVSAKALVHGQPLLKDGWGYAGVIIFLPLGVMHWYAAEGARNGKRYGRILARIIVTLWLFGVPIGTGLGIIAWRQTSSKRWRIA